MSASREKKIRQELAASGAPDPKKIREEEERAKHRRSNTLYGIIAGVFVLVAAFLLLWNSNVIQRGTTAVTVDGTKYSAAEVDYYYYNSYRYWMNSQYGSYMGLSNSTDIHTTKLSEFARSYLQVEGDMTWDAYFKQQSVKSLTQITKLYDLATKDGYTFTEEMQKDLDANLASLKETAKSSGVSQGAYLKAVYGSNMTLATYTKMWKQSAIANAYSEDHEEGLTYTEADLENYYKDHKNDLDEVSFEVIYFNGNPETKTGDDGNAIEATDEEKAAAKTAAHDASKAALDRFNAGEDLETIAKDYENATYNKEEHGTYSTSDVSKWLFDESRKADDVSIVESDPSCYLLLFHSRGRTEARTIDVRHILFQADTSALDKDSETYEADVKAIKDATKAKADEALQNWKNGDATEDSFAAMANELSEDPGSNTNGGLYEKVYEGQMVQTFNDWCFDESRKTGDTGVVETDYGYHVMYFVGDNIPYWQLVADHTLRHEDTETWLKEMVDGAVVTQASGMKYVG